MKETEISKIEPSAEIRKSFRFEIIIVLFLIIGAIASISIALRMNSDSKFRSRFQIQKLFVKRISIVFPNSKTLVFEKTRNSSNEFRLITDRTEIENVNPSYLVGFLNNLIKNQTKVYKFKKPKIEYLNSIDILIEYQNQSFDRIQIYCSKYSSDCVLRIITNRYETPIEKTYLFPYQYKVSLVRILSRYESMNQ